MTAAEPSAAAEGHGFAVTERRSRRRRMRLGTGVAVVPGAALFAVFFVVPLGVLAVYSIYTAGFFVAGPPLSLDAYRETLTSPATWRLLMNSAQVGLPVTVISVGAALPVAYWLRYSAKRLRFPVLGLLVFTIFAGYLVRIYAWRTLLGEHGLVNDALITLGIVRDPIGFLLFSRFAVTIALVHIVVPLAVLMLLGAFRPLEPAYLEAARDLGAGPVRVWTSVILPAIAAPLIMTVLIVFIISSSDWVTPQLLGDGRHPMVGQQIAQSFQFHGNFPAGASLSLIVLACFALLYALSAGLLRAAGLDRLRWGDAAPGAQSPSRLAGAATAVMLVFLYVPLAVVVLFSFQRSSSLSLPFHGLSLRWYEKFLDDPVGVQTMQTSLLVATLVAAITLVVGTATGVGLRGSRTGVRRVLGPAFLLPLSLPPVFIGLALFTFFAQTHIRLSLTTVIVGHAVQTIPLFLIIARATLDRLDPALDDAAADLGANGFAVFRRVTLPQVWPVLAAAAALSFAVSFDEFPVTAFVVGQRATLPFFIYGRLRTTIDPMINVASTMVLGIVLLVVLSAAAMWLVGAYRRRLSEPGT